MRFYLITGAVVATLGIGSTVAIGGGDFFEFEHKHRSSWDRH